MTNMFSKELLDSCVVELPEKYYMSYEYSDDGIYVSVAKHQDGAATIVVCEVIPWPDGEKK